MANLTPTQRTLRALRQQGLVCAVVEKWNAHARVRQDLFGIVDVIALDPARGFIGVQCTGANGWSDHWQKLTVDKAQEVLQWLETPGGVVELWAWRQIKAKRGGKALIWQPRIAEITIRDLVVR